MDARRVSPLTGGVLTLAGLGRIPGGATLAAVVAVGVWLVPARNGWSVGASLLLFAGLLAIAVAALAAEAPAEDPREIVVDEFLGMYAALLFLPGPDYRAALALLVGFRAIDILKPPPFSWIDRWNAPAAILLDDVAIGLCLGAAYRLIVPWLRP
jgi:phosphatidylglycerophosphatase A